MAPRPSHLIVRNKYTGEPMAVPTSEIPQEVWPENWYDQPYWLHNPELQYLRPLMDDYLHNRELNPSQVKILATYFLDYACHIVIMGFLFGGGQEHVDLCLPYIRRLRALKEFAKTMEDLRTMIDVGMEYALDPI